MAARKKKPTTRKKPAAAKNSISRDTDSILKIPVKPETVKGRPRKYSPTMLKIVSEVLESGGSKTQVAAAVGISKETLYDWCNPDSPRYEKAFSDAIKDGLKLSQAWWENAIQQAALGNIPNCNATLMIFNMKNRFKDDWKDRQEFNHGGQKDNPVVNLTGALRELLDDSSK